jgi:coenzyme F420-reducing hydrogenase delta subunit/ferredoxin
MSEVAKSSGFEPRITAFVCKWCTYAGADLAGTSRMTYAPNVRVLMVPCTGRIDVSFVIRAFLQGADGVIVSGCHPGDCHYTAGNYRARRRWILFRDLLDTLGFDLRRFELAWISAAEGAKWVKTIQAFTDRLRDLGPYTALHHLAEDRAPAIAPRASTDVLVDLATAEPEATAVDPQLVAAVAEALEAGTLKAVVGWTKSPTLNRPRPAWFVTAAAAKGMVSPNGNGNLVRLLKKRELRALLPLGLVARACEVAALNVLAQEASIDLSALTVFAVDRNGRYLGVVGQALRPAPIPTSGLPSTDISANQSGSPTVLLVDRPANRPVGFSDETLKALDQLMAKSPKERWTFWEAQSAKCLRCYACRGSCPLCTCDQCIMDKNQPQWFPSAADGPGNFAWQMVRAFHLAGRCVGCGACHNACPAGVPLNLLNAAMARSTLKHFGHLAGIDPKAVPLQSDFRTDDKEDFIL